MARVPNRHVPPRQQRLHPRLPSGLPPVAGGKVETTKMGFCVGSVPPDPPGVTVSDDPLLITKDTVI